MGENLCLPKEEGMKLERLAPRRWPVVASAIDSCFIHEAHHNLGTMRICDYMERLVVGEERFALKIQVFKTQPAIAVRDCRGLALGRNRIRLRCSRRHNDQNQKAQEGGPAGGHLVNDPGKMGYDAHRCRGPIMVGWTLAVASCLTRRKAPRNGCPGEVYGRANSCLRRLNAAKSTE